MTSVGTVVIGRNEGERLAACLRSLGDRGGQVVYVDSGSSDGSPELAASLGAAIIRLDPTLPFTAARARNAGAKWHCEQPNPPRYVQVVDGDCTVHESWIARAAEALDADPGLGIVCGRRRERFPEASVYNLLCDIEWNTRVGPTTACGGDALIRREAFEVVNGYDATMIAGEDPDFAHRVIKAGFRILRLDAEMTLHDAAMTRVGQWWRRTSRSGHAYAECERKHRGDGTSFRLRNVFSIAFWSTGVPLLTAVAVTAAGPVGLAPLIGYPVLWSRLVGHRLRCEDRFSVARKFASYCVLGKWAQAQGAAQYYLNTLRNRSTNLIEYKGAANGGSLPAERR